MTELYRCDLDPRTGRDRFTRATPEEIAASCEDVALLREQADMLRQHAEAMAEQCYQGCHDFGPDCPCARPLKCPVPDYRAAFPAPEPASDGGRGDT